MDRGKGAASAGKRFETYIEGLTGVIGHADRARPLKDYCTGLLLPVDRKSVEPMAAVTAPERTAAQHQSLLHFVGNGGWSDAAVLAQVRAMVLPRGVVLMDAGYGANTDLREAITALDLTYAPGIMPNTTVWTPGTAPLPASGRGRPPRLIRRSRRHKPVSVKELALKLPAKAWRTVTWREGSAEPLTSRFARLRVRVAHRDYNLAAARPEEWLLIEWPKGEAEPAKYWFSTLPERTSLRRLVDLTKLRWRIERDYQDLKQEIGLGQFEGRGWRGFHHHATLCIAAYGFLVAERETFPPSGPRSARFVKTPRLPPSYKPRGAAAAHRTAHPELDCDHATKADRRPRRPPAAMPMLQQTDATNHPAALFMTQ